MHSETERSSELTDALGGGDLSELGEALGYHDSVSLEMYKEGQIE